MTPPTVDVAKSVPRRSMPRRPFVTLRADFVTAEDDDTELAGGMPFGTEIRSSPARPSPTSSSW
jgi:hypothetical protein